MCQSFNKLCWSKEWALLMGTGDQFHGHQMAELREEIYFQPKGKHMDNKKKMKISLLCHPWEGDIQLEKNKQTQQVLR